MSPLIHRLAKDRYSGFSLVEVVVAVLVIGAVLGMIMTSLVMMDHAVANERVINIGEYHSALASNWKTQMGYWEEYGSGGPAFNIAPSRAADAKAEALWRAMHDLYEQSTTVLVLPVYVINDPSQGTFLGNSGYLSCDTGGNPVSLGSNVKINAPPISYSQLINWQLSATTPGGPLYVIANNFPATSSLPFHYWGDSSYPIPSSGSDVIDPNSLRCATVYFLAPHDRILGVLRMRAYEFTSGDPYRYYEVALDNVTWQINNPNTGMSTFYSGQNLIETYSYRFVEDKLYPQDLIFPPTQTQMQTIEGGGAWPAAVSYTPGTITYTEYRDEFIRLAYPEESYVPSSQSWALNTNPAASRRQVSLASPNLSTSTVLPANTDEWHMILPDPGIDQAEERANLHQNPNVNGTDITTADWNIRRQGKYGCVLSLYP
jgi:type II secretory pathway pseudopilin PulG